MMYTKEKGELFGDFPNLSPCYITTGIANLLVLAYRPHPALQSFVDSATTILLIGE